MTCFPGSVSYVKYPHKLETPGSSESTIAVFWKVFIAEVGRKTHNSVRIRFSDRRLTPRRNRLAKDRPTPQYVASVAGTRMATPADPEKWRPASYNLDLE